MSWKETWKTIFWPEWDSGGLSLTRDQVALRVFENAESPATTGTLSTAWTGTNVTVTRETTAPLNGEGSLKVAVAGGTGSVYKSFDRAMFGYPFPGHNGIRVRYVKFRATCGSGSKSFRLTFGDASDANHYRYWTFTVEQDKTVEWVVDLDPDNTESYPAPTTGSTTWDPEQIDRFGFTNLESGVTYYFDDIEFLYEYSLVDILGFSTEAPVDMGDVGSINARINGLWANVKALEGRTYQYDKVGPSELEVGDEGVWGLELMSDFAPPTTTEIEPGNYNIVRVRHGVSTTIVASTPASESAGLIYVTYQPQEDNWTEGDVMKIQFTDGYVRTDEDPSNALTANATAGNDYVDVPNAYEYQVGWLVRVYDSATPAGEYKTVLALPTPTRVQFSAVLTGSYTTANTATITRAIRTDLDTALLLTRLVREPMIEFEGNSFFETDREDGAHAHALPNSHWGEGVYKLGAAGTQSAIITGGKVVVSQSVAAGDYAAKNLYSIKSKYFRVVVDLDVTFTTPGAGSTAGLAMVKGTAYAAGNNVEVYRFKDGSDNHITSRIQLGGGDISTSVDTTDDAVALMIERNDRTWRCWYSLTKFPDYEWVLLDEVDDTADAFGEQSSAFLFAGTADAAGVIVASFDNYKYIIDSKFLEQIYDIPAVIPIFDKQVDPRVDQNTATGIEIFRVGLMDIKDGLPTLAEITPGTTLVDRFREGTDADWTNQAGETITNGEVAGYIYALYDFPNATWKPGDQARMRLTGVKVTDAATSRVYEVPDFSIYFVVGGPPNQNETQNLWLGDVIGGKTDQPVFVADLTSPIIRYSKGALLSTGIVFRGTATGGATTSVVCGDTTGLSNLIGFGTDFFKNRYWIQILKNANSAGNAPEGEIRRVTAYATATGTFTTDAFSAAVEASDEFLVLHEDEMFVRQARGDMYRGICKGDMAGSTTAVVSLELVGFGDDYFNDKYYVEVVKNSSAVGTAPEHEIRKITNYASDSGTFTTEAFTANVEAGDELLILHETQVAARLRGGLAFTAEVNESGGAATDVHLIELSGFGDDYFNNNWFVQVQYTTDGAAPRGEIQRVTDYTSTNGVFATAAFTVALDKGDKVLLIHESLIAVGRNDADNIFDSTAVIANVDGSVLERQEWAQTHGMSALFGIVTTGGSDLGLSATRLTGYGDDFFKNHYYVQCLKSATVTIGTTKKITGYTSTTGAFTFASFGANWGATDQFAILHESLVAVGRDDANNEFASTNVVGDQNGSLIERLELAQSHGIIGVFGVVSTGGSDVTLTAVDLIGYGDDFFKTHYYVQVLKSALVTIGTTKKVTGYTSTTGAFTFASFGANFTTGDIFVVIHESAVAIGRDDADNEFASTNVVANLDGSLIERLEWMQSRGMPVLLGVVTTGGSDVTLAATQLNGYGTDFFKDNYYVQALKSALVTSGTTKKITGYTSASGTFTFGSFGANWTAADTFLVLHESLVAIGRNDANNEYDSSTVTPNADGSILERLEDIHDDIGDASGLFYRGVATGGSATTAVIPGLIGFGDDYFNTKFFIQIVYNANSHGNSPEPKTRVVTGYDTATGTFSFVTVTDAVEAGDYVLIFHESLAATGRNDADNAYDSSAVVGNQNGSILERLELAQSHGLAAVFGVVTTGGSDVTLAALDLVGYEDDFFKTHYYVQVLKSTLVTIGTTKKVTGYTSITGVFTFASFGANFTAGDIIVVLHESLVAIGRNDANNEFDSGNVVADDDGSILERAEYIQQQLGYGVRLLTETAGASTTLITAAEITEAAGWWKNALILGITGANIGVCRPVVSNTVGTITVYPALRAPNVVADTYLLISAYKPQIFEQQADTAVNLSLVAGVAATNVFSLATAGYSYEVNQLVLKSADPTGGGATAQTVTISLYELINDVSTLIDTFTIDGTNFGTYFSLFDMFGQVKLTGDSLIVTAALSAGATTPIALTGQYQHALVYTGTG